MIESEKYEPPKRRTSDIAYATARAGVSSIPLIGAAATELLQLLLTPPLEKRRDEWLHEMGQALLDLEKHRSIKLEELQTNEAFITVLMQASQTALWNHQRDKIEALRNAVINSANAINIEEDLQFQFIRYIDELTASHFALLKFIADHEQQLGSVETYEQLYQQVVDRDFLRVDREEFKLLCADLTARVLLRISPDVEDFDDIFQPDILATDGNTSERPMLRITDIGRKLLAFVARNN